MFQILTILNLEWGIASNTQRPMDPVTNTFCAVGFSITWSLFAEHTLLAKGGNVLGNGTWLNVGGNRAVTFGGVAADSQNGGGPYDDPDGRQSFVVTIPSVFYMLTTRHI